MSVKELIIKLLEFNDLNAQIVVNNNSGEFCEANKVWQDRPTVDDVDNVIIID